MLFCNLGYSLSIAILMVVIAASVRGQPTNPPECRPGQFYDSNIFSYRMCSICFTTEGSMFYQRCNKCNCTKGSVQTRPTKPSDCPPGKFYDSHTFEYRSCSMCYTKDGRQFAWECKRCNCKKEQTSTPGRYTPTLPGSLPQTTTGKSPTTRRYTSTLPGSPATLETGNDNATSRRVTEPKEDSYWIIPLIVSVVIIIVIAVVTLIVYFKRHRGSLEHRQQGYYFSIKNTELQADLCTQSSLTIDNDFAYVISESKRQTHSVETFV